MADVFPTPLLVFSPTTNPTLINDILRKKKNHHSTLLVKTPTMAKNHSKISHIACIGA
jgi:hypothetical protein